MALISYLEKFGSGPRVNQKRTVLRAPGVKVIVHHSGRDDPASREAVATAIEAAGRRILREMKGA